MRQEDEQGFLSGKFDDWSGEPIPNGWNSIESRLDSRKNKQRLLLAGIPLLLLISYSAYFLKTGKNDASVNLHEVGLYSQMQTEIPSSLPLPAATHSVIPAENAGSSVSFSSSSRQPNESIPEGLTRSSASKLESEEFTGAGPNFKQPTSEAGVSNASEVGTTEILPETAFEPTTIHEVGRNLSASELAGTILPLVLKTPVLGEMPALSLAARPHFVPTGSKASFWLDKSFSIQAGYAVSTILLNHAESEGWKYGISKDQFTQAGFLSAGLQLGKFINRSISLFYGMEGGVWMRRMELTTSSRIPQTYIISEEGDTRYSVTPASPASTEVRTSQMLFAVCEIGIRKAIMPRAGLLASARFWGRISASGRSDLKSSASFSTATKSFAPGYRLGLWVQTGLRSQAEFSFASFPEQLASATPGFEFNTSLLSLSFRRQF